MNKGWPIALLIVIIIVGSLVSVYMMRSVGVVSIDLDAMKASVVEQEQQIAAMDEKIVILEEQNMEFVDKIKMLEADAEATNQRLEEVDETFINLPISKQHLGVIKNLIISDGFMEFEIDEKEWLEGQDAIDYVMETYEISQEAAEEKLPNLFYIKDIPDTRSTYWMKFTKNVELLKGNETEQVNVQALIEKIENYASIEDFPLLIIDAVGIEVLKVTEAYLP